MGGRVDYRAMLAFKFTPWWGTLPDWIAALGTVGALFAGLRLLRKELETRREDVEDRRRAQARLVAAWASPPERRHDRTKDTSAWVFYVLTRNGSDEPVRNVTVTFYRPPSSQPSSLEPVFRMRYPVLSPQTTEEWGPLPAERDPLVGPPVAIVFRDSQGYMWQRERDGLLQLLASPASSTKKRRSVKDRLHAWARGQVDELDT
jgi:hypothetical protein